ncbi:MAG TPA: peptide chain release factor N(5)-glutamine methyltransferase, partial [Saprospiraceae bacterium]|nr:peptide chain release factor N(5)-glutamine methyltransferase [Saprospiraceae bacterium]
KKEDMIQLFGSTGATDGWLVSLRSGQPIQYILEETSFMGLNLEVNPDVLIPRSETEELVASILDIEHSREQARVLDIGTGSGCIALAIKHFRPEWEVIALDRSEAALDVARRNAIAMQLEIEFIPMDFLQASFQWSESFDLIISNPPYVDRQHAHLIPQSVLNFEPEIALFPPGQDPLIFYRKIAEWGKENMNPDAAIYLELNEFYANEIRELMIHSGYGQVQVENDLQGAPRLMKVVR